MNRIIPESLPPALELFDALLAADLADDRPLAALTLLSVVPVLSQSAGRTKSDQNHRRHCRVVTHARKDEPAFVHAPPGPSSLSSAILCQCHAYFGISLCCTPFSEETNSYQYTREFQIESKI